MKIIIKILLCFALVSSVHADNGEGKTDLWPYCEGGLGFLQCSDENLKKKVLKRLNEHTEDFLEDNLSDEERNEHFQSIIKKAVEQYTIYEKKAFEYDGGHYPTIKSKKDYKIYMMFKLTAYYFENVEEFSSIHEKDLGNGFTLRQSTDASYLILDNATIYNWKHASAKNPFIWDEGCELLTTKLDELYSAASMSKDEVWNTLSEEEQRECIKENTYKNISITKINESFFIVNKQHYESAIRILYDKEKNRLYPDLGISLDEVVKLEVGKSGVFLQYRGGRGNEGGVLFLDNTSNRSKILFKNTDESLDSITFIETLDFELEINKQILVRYRGQNGDLKEKLVPIN